MEFENYLKAHFSHLFKKNGQSFANSKQTRVEELKNTRRMGRLKTLNGRRQIPADLSPMTPSPRSVRRQDLSVKENTPRRAPVVTVQVDERKKRLDKWKLDRARALELARKDNKPIFKVGQVSAPLGLPNLENINKEIKGKKFALTTVKDLSVSLKNQAPTLTRMITRSMRHQKPKSQQKKVERDKNTAQKTDKQTEDKAATAKKITKNNTPQLTIVPDKPLNYSTSPKMFIEEAPVGMSPVRLSPFVTVARGKDKARKEFKQRRSTMNPESGAAYFSYVLDNQIAKLNKECEAWIEYKESQIPEEATAMIDVAIGQATLFTTKKCNQFRNLIEKAGESNVDLPVTCEDLHGFWDLMMIQVRNLDDRFENLVRLRANDWKEIVPIIVKKKVVKKEVSTKKAVASSGLREAIQSRRLRNKAILNAEHKSPEQSSLCPAPLLSSARKSLTSPGLAILNVSQLAKTVETPRSILKSMSSISQSHGKSVLFEESGNDDKENMLRRSARRQSRRVKLF